MRKALEMVWKNLYYPTFRHQRGGNKSHTMETIKSEQMHCAYSRPNGDCFKDILRFSGDVENE